ncbi:Benzyl alcohol O-benzoyltransferase [Linum grandiflorum]
MIGKDPATVIRRALADALVPYYPFAGRMREGPNRKLMVDCTVCTILFIEADADVWLADFGQMIQPPFPCIEQLLFDVTGSSAILHAPLLLIQVTQLQCGGFILALRLHHCMSDAVGFVQFMFALSELACGAITLSILPVSRSPPRVTCTHREYENVMVAADSMIINKLDDQMEHRSFYFGLVEISALRSHAPPHLRNSNSHIELITACAWKCRTILPLNLTLTMRCSSYASSTPDTGPILSRCYPRGTTAMRWHTRRWWPPPMIFVEIHSGTL